MTEFRALINGLAGPNLVVTDRGFAYGDGVFRTIRIAEGRPWLCARHLTKLRADAEVLGIRWRPEWDDLLCEEIARLTGCESGTLRLVLTRGSGPRGDRPPEDAWPRRLLIFYPGEPPVMDGLLRNVRVCRTPMPQFPPLAGIKHLNRLPQVLARQEWAGPDPAEGLMLDAAGHLVCGTMSNLFLRRGSTLFTPDLTQAGVAGIMRGLVLERPWPEGVERVLERQLKLEDLRRADEAFVTNAVIGLWPLGKLVDAQGALLRHWQAEDIRTGRHLLQRWREQL